MHTICYIRYICIPCILCIACSILFIGKSIILQRLQRKHTARGVNMVRSIIIEYLVSVGVIDVNTGKLDLSKLREGSNNNGKNNSNDTRDGKRNATGSK